MPTAKDFSSGTITLDAPALDLKAKSSNKTTIFPHKSRPNSQPTSKADLESKSSGRAYSKNLESGAMLSEADGRIVLKEAFESKGYCIQENYLLSLNGLDIELDGYDAAAKVGYEYLTSEDGLECEALDQLIDSPDYKIFLMDEEHVPNAWVLAEAVLDFLRRLES